MAHYDRWLILDVASAPLPDAERHLEGTVRAPSNWKDEEKIAAYIAEKQADRLAMAAVDVDLACVTGMATWRFDNDRPLIQLARVEGRERDLLSVLAANLEDCHTIITFGGFNFDLPLVMRRARYLGVPFPTINLDRYRSPHRDLCEELSDRNPQRRRSLGFYVRRMGWTDLHKTLDGAEEAKVHQTGRWDDLADSLRHDVTATKRLAEWLGVIQPAAAEAVGF